MTAPYLRYPHLSGDLLTFVAADDVWLAPVDGGRAWRLTDEHAPANNPRLSPTATHVAWAAARGRGRGREVFCTAVDGGSITQLTFWGSPQTNVLGWTEDGRILVSSAAGEHQIRDWWLKAIDLDGHVERLAYGPASGLARGADGTVVVGSAWAREPAYWKRYRGGTAPQLWIDRAASGRYERLLPDLDAGLAWPMWLDGRIAFVSDHDGVGNVWSVDADGGDLRAHTHHGSDDGYVRTASTDGTRITYHALGDVFVMDTLETEPHRVPISLGGALAGRDARRLVTDQELASARPTHDGAGVVAQVRGQAFHLTNPRRQKSGEVINEFARAAHAPQLALRIDKRLTDALPKGTISMLMKLPQVRDIRRTVLTDFGIPAEVIDHMALKPQFDTRDTERALEGSGITVPELGTYADKLWDYWERNLDPDLFKDRSFGKVINAKTVIITGASSGIGRATALQVAAAGGIPLLVARGMEKLEALRDEIAALGGTAHVYSADLSDMEAIDDVVARILADHPAVDFLVNNAGRSIRRSVKLSEDRFHDFERTMQLNYFGAIKLTMGLLPHMRERGGGHVVNVSSIGAQTNPPRFSAYVASKAALDAWTRCVGSEVIGDGVTFTTIHMPLVRTPMIAPTKMYDAFPTITPEEAADMICEAIRARPKTINTRLGTFGEVAYALAPKAVDQILHMAYKVFPDSAASKGKKDPDEKASMEQLAMANLMKGVHW